MISSKKSFFDFINENLNNDILSLRLSLKKTKESSHLSNKTNDFAIVQIECRQKARTKLSGFLSNFKFLFPDTLSAEQASHEAIARYHAYLSADCHTILDMTAGLGIDAMTMAKKGKKVTAVDIDNKRSSILRYNCHQLGITTLEAVCADSMEIIADEEKLYDLIFIDPSRRDSNNNRFHNLRACVPDVVGNKELLLNHGSKILIKASPMLDISETLNDFPEARSIKAVGVKGECKEILVEISSASNNNVNQEIKLEAINLDTGGNIISQFSVVKSIPGIYTDYASKNDLITGKYLLEPSAMVMKLSPWHQISERFKAKKLGKNSHLFISEEKPEGFPGRVTSIERILSKKDFTSFKGKAASVVSRNHPQTADSLRKQLQLIEGDSRFIYATRIGEKPILIEARIIKD